MKGFLNSYMGRNRHLELQSAADIEEAFVPTIDAVSTAVGASAFRPRGYMNAAVFDSVMVGLARGLAAGYRPTPKQLASAYRKLVRSRGYVDATEVGTNAAQSVEARLRLSTEAFKPKDK